MNKRLRQRIILLVTSCLILGGMLILLYMGMKPSGEETYPLAGADTAAEAQDLEETGVATQKEPAENTGEKSNDLEESTENTGMTSEDAEESKGNTGTTNEDSKESTENAGTKNEEAEDTAGNPKETLDRQVDEKIDSMTLEEKVAQLFILTPEALTGYGTVTQAGAATKSALEKYPVGGLIYFSPNIVTEEQTTDMIAAQQEYSTERIGLPLFISVDEEGGKVTRIASNENISARDFESMAKIGVTGDFSKAYEVGDVIGEYLSRMGFNLNFAPVADVLTNAENTVVKERSYGSEPKLVSEMVQKQLEGMQAHGVYGCVKHFPGHGATKGDTHMGYAYTDKTWEELKMAEIVPFEESIANGVSFIMVGHISLPQVTGDGVPASCSPQMIQGYLRDELGYDGIVLTDALAMKAITEQYTSAQAAVATLQAGGDMLLMPKDFQGAYQGILAAIEDGRLTEERIDESVRRILRVKLNMK